MLTGKCKKDFDKWLPNVHQVIADGINGDFHTLHLSLIYGVYVDFFTEIGFKISWQFDFDEIIWNVSGLGNPARAGWGYPVVIEDARKESVLKANEIYNQTIKTLA